ncbi:pilus (MSHA type) biogenesis protein MshL [Catenovulum sp. 2E275]|uniref:pilus (MSHA type) biogenesis protein MshL n=1 Tax=Catenovulum sp. 2E275 TaxID=2980497 RepID=UPI0021D29EDB|nr:pilus (MSHA type) biogenesis protein MshL [Catenovulum sp. 2E275]MCU4675057.1 pilus (MSHA type) biogenesis protein MshL [Catenovulum sp. 2E275]
MQRLSKKIQQTPLKTYLAFSLLTGLIGCQSTQLEPQIEQSLNEPAPVAEQAVPAAVLADLVPKFDELANQPQLQEKRYDIDTNEVPVGAFFQSLVQDTPLNVVVHPNVGGQISLSLKGVTLAEVIDVVTDMYGYDIKLKGRLLQIYPTGMRTETFSVNYLAMQRNGISYTSIQSGGVTNPANNQNGSGYGANNRYSDSPSTLGLAGQEYQNSSQYESGNTLNNGTRIVSSNKNNFWDDLTTALRTLIGEGENRNIIVNPQAGLVTVKALPEELRSVKAFLQSTEQQMQRQVILEAKVIEVSLSDAYQQGIQWEAILGRIDSTEVGTSRSGATLGNTITNTLAGVTSLTFNNGDFTGLLQLLKTQGNVQVLSSPRLTAANNQKAVIKVGTDEYFVTNVSTTTVTGTATTSSPNIELEPFFSGIALDVTPQIDSAGSVILHVHPSVIDTTEQVKVVTLNEQDFTLPLAQSNVRESDTIIKANSGEIVVIGGLMQTITSDKNSKVPLLGDIPGLGSLFTSLSQETKKKELIIMIKPTVVGQTTWQEQRQRSSELLEQWYK